MSRLDETAYRQLKATPTERELRELYTPTLEERDLASQHTTGKPALVAFLALLKTFQHLGYAVALSSVPMPIVSHLAKHLDCQISGQDLITYDLSGTRRRHLQVIRAHLGIVAEGTAMREACESKDEIIDLINIAIEQLIRKRFELPAFSTLERAAKRLRAENASALHTQVASKLTTAEQEAIDRLFVVDEVTEESLWHALKVDPKNPTLSHFEEVMERARWLLALPIATDALADLPEIKIQRFATEALALDAKRMRELQVRKRTTLVLSLLRFQRAQALDDVAEMFCKRLLKSQHQAQEAFELAQKAARERVTRLIEALRDVTHAYEKEGTIEERMAAIDAVYGGHSALILTDCEAQLALLANTHLPFLRTFISRHRASLFRFLSTVTLRAPHQNKALEETIQFLQANEHRSGLYLPTARIEQHRGQPRRVISLVDLSWMSDTWRRILTGQRRRALHPERVHRQHFEACVFTQILWDLKTGDLYVEGSDCYANTWAQGISWETYAASVEEYGGMLGFPIEGPDFVAHLQTWLATIAQETDRVFPESRVTIERGEPVIHKAPRRATPVGLKYLEKLLAPKLEDIHLLEVMVDVQHWLDWCKSFGPLSGFETKLEDATLRQILTVFAYGTHMGPAQMARSFTELHFRHLSWIHHEHMSEEKLDQAIDRVINGYAKFNGKLNTYSHKNQLYQAFRELGRVIRTGFLLQYVGDPELRAIIQRETNKSESFNSLTKWLAFGNSGVIPTNNRREMRKYLKYNHLLANLVIFANVALLTNALNELVSEGHRIEPEAVAALSPYMTQHLIRFGLYQVDRTRPPKPLTYEIASFELEEIQEEAKDV